ncbi:MAG: hypothetical protein H0W15_07230 [Gemmatimonadales bacterium]|nr:hypothetical protein [Gemmatimonadales bacterium]
MMHDLFSADGLAAWRLRLDASPAFRDAARDWSGTLVLRERGGGPVVRRTWIELDDGRLGALRAADDHDEASAEFVLEGSPETWRGLVLGSRDLAAAALAGDVALQRGSIWKLIPHVKAASSLLAAARADDGHS